MNICFMYKLLLADSWGGLHPDGSATGMLGMVARRDVEFAISEITITESRETVIDFTSPYFLESTTVLTPAPKEVGRAGAVFAPFTPMVWAGLIVSTLLIGPVLAGVSCLMGFYLRERPECSIRTYAFHMFRNLVMQGNLISSPHWPHRFIFLFWYLFCFYIYAMYSGTLTAFLAVPSFEKPIDSLWDLLRACEEEGYQPMVTYDTANVFLFEKATSGIYKEIWERFQPENGYVYTGDEGVEKVLTGKYAYLGGRLASEVRMTIFGQEQYHLARQTFQPQAYGVMLNSGSPYKGVFDKALLQLVESGLVGKWTRDEVDMARGRTSAGGEGGGEILDERGEGERGGEKEQRERRRRRRARGGADGGPGAISVTHLQAAFFLLATGLLLAALALLAEWAFARRGRGRRQTAQASVNPSVK
ncbi:glutamate receptor ionotropic, delta-2-like [Penaeus vannamei]|uniref:glutamate receptor ionotropic, delta-2-like n=1 Tax=Penaeus vannamei TaxID=6689 RepID=UPI00387F9DCB